MTTPPPAAAHQSLSKYERTYVIGVRAEQLSRGAQAFVPMPEPVVGCSSVQTMYALAERELEAGVLPLVVARKMPDGSVQNVPLGRRAE